MCVSLFQMMFCVVVTGVDSRVIVQTSMSVRPDHRQQSLRKLRRFKLNCTRPNSLYNDDDKKEDVAVTLSWLLFVKERRQQTSTPSSSSLGGVQDIVPDISRLDFFRQFPARGGGPLRGSSSRQSGGSWTLNLPVWKLTDAGDGGEDGRVSRMSGLLPRSVVGGRTERSTAVDSSKSGRDWRTAVMVAVVSCLAVGLLLTALAVWMRRRRRLLRTTPKL